MQPAMPQRAGAGAAHSLKRIMREYHEISSEANSFWTANPLSLAEPHEWHFTMRGPADSDFEGGMYHGRIVLPQNYPLGPPSVMLLTPNGRFEVGKKVCLSASNYHPELWQPAWGLRSLLDALHAFFPTPGEGALHSLDWPSDVRKKIAKESINFRCSACGKTNIDIVQESCLSPTRDKPNLPWTIASPTAAQSSTAGASSASSAPTAAAPEATDATSPADRSVLPRIAPRLPSADHSSSSSSFASIGAASTAQKQPADAGQTPKEQSSVHSLSSSTAENGVRAAASPSGGVASDTSTVTPNSRRQQAPQDSEADSPQNVKGSTASEASPSVAVGDIRTERSGTSAALWALLMSRVPRTKNEGLLCAADLLVLLVVVLSLFIILDIANNPPQIIASSFVDSSKKP